VYTVPKDWTLTPEQRAVLERLGISIQDAIRPLAEMVQSAAEQQRQIAAICAAAKTGAEATIAEIDEYSYPEILHALRTTYGAKADPTRRLELLHDKDGRLPEFVSIKKAERYARVTERRIEQLVAEGRLRAVGGKGHRRVLVADLIKYYPPEK
jgi:hypothetical protein